MLVFSFHGRSDNARRRPVRVIALEHATMNTRFVTTVAAAAALGGLLFGYDTSTMNAAIAGVRASLGLNSGQVGLVAAISLLGCAAGAWLAGPISVRLGRK